MTLQSFNDQLRGMELFLDRLNLPTDIEEIIFFTPKWHHKWMEAVWFGKYDA